MGKALMAIKGRSGRESEQEGTMVLPSCITSMRRDIWKLNVGLLVFLRLKLESAIFATPSGLRLLFLPSVFLAIGTASVSQRPPSRRIATYGRPLVIRLICPKFYVQSATHGKYLKSFPQGRGAQCSRLTLGGTKSLIDNGSHQIYLPHEPFGSASTFGLL